MIEADAPSTGRFSCPLRSVCSPHRGYSCSHHQRFSATRRGRKGKAALGRGPPTKRGQGQYTMLLLVCMSRRLERPSLVAPSLVVAA